MFDQYKNHSGRKSSLGTENFDGLLPGGFLLQVIAMQMMRCVNDLSITKNGDPDARQYPVSNFN